MSYKNSCSWKWRKIHKKRLCWSLFFNKVGRWRPATLFKNYLSKSYLSKIPKKSAFSKSLIVMKCFKYLIFVFVKHWILNCQSLILKTRRKELPGHPLLGNGNTVNLSIYLNNSKQILEYFFRLTKYMESWHTVLINQLTTTILQQ